MFDKNWFYYTENISNKKYNLDLWLTNMITIENNEYVVFHKRRFKTSPTSNLQKWMWLLTKSEDISFNFSKEFFIYWLTYYQRNLKDAFIKKWWIEELNLYNWLFKIFWLELKYRDSLEIRWNYIWIEEINKKIEYANLDEAISFLFALAIIYWDWNIIEENNDIFLWNIFIKFPFENSLAEFQNIIFSIEDKLSENWIFNKLNYTKKQEFIWNIIDYDMLKLFWKLILEKEFKVFFQSDEILNPIFKTHKESLSKQLNTDLRINLDNFKLTEIEWISLNF